MFFLGIFRQKRLVGLLWDVLGFGDIQWLKQVSMRKFHVGSFSFFQNTWECPCHHLENITLSEGLRVGYGSVGNI